MCSIHIASHKLQMKAIARIVALVAAFSAASAATYVAINKWRATDNKPNTAKKSDTLDGVTGLTAGEVVSLPVLTNLAGESVSLNTQGKARLLCVFISNRCPGCTKDVDLWRELHKVASQRDAAFYLINVGEDRAELEQFVAAYALQQLPVLFDPSHQVGPQLKVGFLPQYILFDKNGRVLHRWDGIRQFHGDAEQLAEFFRPGND